MSSATATTCYTPEGTWRVAADFPLRAEIQELRREGPCGARTLLARLRPGDHIAPHAHRGVVQHFVVEGSYECDGETFAAGTYRLFPAHANLCEITSAEGATVLMVYDPV